MHCYSAGCIPSTSLKTFATFSPKKVVNLTAVPCHMLASEDGMEGDRCHGERWDTGSVAQGPRQVTSPQLMDVWVSDLLCPLPEVTFPSCALASLRL